MKPADYFYVYYPFSLILYCMGFSFNNNKSLHSIITKILRLKSLLLLIYLVVYTCQNYFDYRSKKFEKFIKFNFFYLSTYIKSLIIIASFVIFTFKFGSISRLLLEIERHLNDKNRKSMKRFNTILAIFWTLAISANTGIYIFTTKTCVKDADIYTLLKEALWTLQAIAWFFTTHCVFVLSCYGIHLIETNSFEWMTNIAFQIDACSMRFLPKYKDLYEKIALILNLKNSVNNALGFLPMLYLCMSFSSTCLRLTHLSIHKECINAIILVLYFFEYSLIQSFNLFVIISVIHYQSKRLSSDQVMNYYRTYFENEQSTTAILQQNSLQSLLTSYCNFEYKAWNIFTIDKPLLLSFISTVVTFTVMLIQLIDN